MILLNIMFFIPVLEYVGPKWRTFVANMSIAIFFTFATCILPWIAYYLADWRMTCIVTSVPLVLAVATPWLIPESARWLVSQGQIDRAIKILGKFERINGTKVPDDIYKRFRVKKPIIAIFSVFCTFMIFPILCAFYKYRFICV